MDIKTKDMFEVVSKVKRIDISGMAVFDMPLLGADGKAKKESEEMKLAVRCEKGDIVVRQKVEGVKRRPCFVIPQKEWADMPKDEAAYKTQAAALATPQLAEMQAKIAALEAAAQGGTNGSKQEGEE